MPNRAEIWQARTVFADFQLGRSLEPEHHGAHSDVVHAAIRNGQPVVVKQIRPPFPLRDPARDEAVKLMDLVRTVSTPHALPVIDHGIDPDGYPFYAMDFAFGTPVAALERTYSATETFKLLCDVVAAVEVFTHAGITTDLHPRHVMLHSGGARIWNVGIAAWSRAAYELVGPQVTRAGVLLWHGNLTPYEAMGRPWTPANTCAQLALLAFNLLAGRWYWQGDLQRESSMAHLADVFQNQGPPPSGRSRAPLPEGFDAWFAQCLTGGIPHV
ncbi:MAG TPA: hypothetical protein VGC41_12230, partial [Kofleriaceae bacterium]